MPWTCPTCHRPFKHENQGHSCVAVKVEQHFESRPKVLFDTFQTLMDYINTFDSFTISPVKSSIMIKKNATFMSVKVKKDHLVVEFFLSRTIEEPPIIKTSNYTKNKVVHTVALYEPNDIKPPLTEWLKESYDLFFT